MIQHNSLIKQKLDDYFKSQNDSDEKIFYQLMLYIFGLESKQHDLFLIAKIIPLEHAVSLVNYFAGDTIKMPSKEQAHDNVVLAIAYYLKCIKGMNWTEIKELLNLPEKDKDLISSISVGYRINALNDTMSRDLKDILKQVKTRDYKELLMSLKRKTEEVINE
jgi:hypothetical protein